MEIYYIAKIIKRNEKLVGKIVGFEDYEHVNETMEDVVNGLREYLDSYITEIIYRNEEIPDLPDFKDFESEKRNCAEGEIVTLIFINLE